MSKTRRANGEGSWSKRKDGSLKLHMTYDGKPKDFYGKTKQEVLAKKRAYEALAKVDPANQPTISVETYINEWMEKIQKPILKKKSFDRKMCTIDNWIVPTIGDIALNRLDTIDVQEKIIQPMYDAGRARSTIKQARNALNSMYTYAVATRKVDFNPITAVTIPSIDKFEKKEIRYFSQDERNKFVDACYAKTTNGKDIYAYGALFVFMLYTGLRMGEALALTWEDVDLANRKVHVHHTLIVVSNNKPSEKTRWVIEDQLYTKTNSNRVIYLCDMALEALNILQSKYEHNNNDYIVNNNGNPINPRRAARTFKAICKRANIENANPHCLRHSCASLMHSNKIPLSVISGYLGHSNEATTAKIYLHLLADDSIASQSIIKGMK